MLKNKKGITLVELLIVVVILGIIAAISIPAVGNIVENAQKDTVITDAGNLRNAASLCISAGDCDFVNTDGKNLGGRLSEVDGELPEYVVFGSALLNTYIDIDAEKNYYVVYSRASETDAFTFDFVLLETEDWFYVGDPRDAERDHIIEVPDDLTVGEVGEEDYYTGTPWDWEDAFALELE